MIVYGRHNIKKDVSYSIATLNYYLFIIKRIKGQGHILWYVFEQKYTQVVYYVGTLNPYAYTDG